MINQFFYHGQIRKYLLQFCYIFAGLKVQTGRGECDVPEFMTVPITMGSKDRVVAAIMAGNTQNKPFAVPAMAVHLTGLELSQNRKGVGVVDKKVFLPSGGVYPDDLRSTIRVMPIPYEASVDLTLYASNTQQLHQMLEQVLVLFDPTIQIQTSDGAFDWTKLTTVELTSISNEENYPAGSDRRVINWTLSFRMPIYLSLPVDVRNDLVRKIVVTIGDLDSFTVGEIDSNGDIIAFDAADTYGTVEITGRE